MSKKNILSVFLISLAGVLVWFVGFVIIMLLKFENSPEVNRGWLIIVFSGTIIMSVAKNLKNDDNDKER